MSRFSLFTATATLCLVAGGCAVGPDHVPPDDVVGSSFTQDVMRGRVGSALPEDSPRWWSGFGDPMLTRLVDVALAQNLDLATALAVSAQARAQLAEAGAALRPTGSIAAQAARAHQSMETPLGRVASALPGYERTGNSHEVGAAASWELDLAGGLRRGQEAAMAGYEASQAGVAAARLAVVAATVDTYVQIRGLQARLDIARKRVVTEEALLEKVRLLHSKGLVPETSVRQAQLSVAIARAMVPQIEAGLRNALNSMDVILGAQPGTHRADLSGAMDVPVAPVPSDVGAPADLLRRRPDLVIAERRLAAASAQIGQATAEYFPKVSLSGLVGSATTISAANLFSGPANQAIGLIGLRWRLFDVSRIDAEIEQARGRQAEALAAYRLAALKATADVENSVYALSRTAESAESLRQGVAALRDARRHAHAAYSRGAASEMELLHADNALLSAEDAYVVARAELARTSVGAFKSLGGGWPTESAERVAAASDSPPPQTSSP